MKMERIYFSINKLMNYINENKVFEQLLFSRIEDPYDNNVRILCQIDDDYLLGGKLNSIYLLSTNNTIFIPHESIICIFDNKQPFVTLTPEEIRSDYYSHIAKSHYYITCLV